MKICLTGGSGYIGRSIARRLLDSGATLRRVTRRSSLCVDEADFFRADLSDPACTLHGLFDDVDVMLHCAGEIREQSLMVDLHVGGMYRLLQELQAHFSRTGRPLHWVQLSSVGAYGPGVAELPRQVTEETPAAPTGCYETSKTAADQMLIDFAAAQPLLNYTILRPSIVIGKEMSNQSVRALIRHIRQRRFFYIGWSPTVSTYIHLDDVTEALWLCVTEPAARGHIFNLSNDCLLSEIVGSVAMRYGQAPTTWHLPHSLVRSAVSVLGKWIRLPLNSDRINALVSRTTYSSEKIRRVLGFYPRRSIPEAILELCDE